MNTATNLSLPGITPDPIPALLDWAITERRSIHLIGPHGIGKTSYITDLATRRGLRVVAKSLAVCSQRDFAVPVPVTGPAGEPVLRVLLLDELRQQHRDDRYVLLLDEFSRADAETRNTAMELLQEHTLAGEPLPGLAAVVALDNPVGDDDYAGVGALDLAQADRVATLELEAEDIPWRAHLEKVHGVELDQVLTLWRSYTPATRKVLCPRVLDHLLTLHAAGMPLAWALPVAGEGRARLTEHDTDATNHILAELEAAIVPTLGQPVGAEGRIVRAITTAITDGWNLRLVGAPGIGKTSHVREAVDQLDLELEYVSLSQTSLTDLVVPVPIDGRLRFLPAERLVRPDRRYVLVLDEFSRAPIDIASAAMELVNERTLAGNPLPGCVAVIAMDNPGRLGELTFDAGRIDAAQASRFTATIEVTEDDLPWREFLLERHPEQAPVFLDWRAEDLDDQARVLVSPRCLERMISLHAAGLDPAIGLPVLDGERVPVPLGSLRQRLRGDGNRLGLSAIVEKLDQHAAALRDGDDVAQLTVLSALSRADTTALRRHDDAVVALLTHLHPNHRLALVRGNGPSRALFIDAISRITTEEAA